MPANHHKIDLDAQLLKFLLPFFHLLCLAVSRLDQADKG